jgi:hypothetical protein
MGPAALPAALSMSQRYERSTLQIRGAQLELLYILRTQGTLCIFHINRSITSSSTCHSNVSALSDLRYVPGTNHFQPGKIMSAFTHAQFSPTYPATWIALPVHVYKAITHIVHVNCLPASPHPSRLYWLGDIRDAFNIAELRSAGF